MKKIKQSEIFFKAGRKNSESHSEYREIIKRGDKGSLGEDVCSGSDDAIKIYTDDIYSFGIDCDKKTGEFRLFFTKR